MRTLFIIIAAGIIGFTGCKEDEGGGPVPQPYVKTSIPFTGVWGRKFETRPGNFQTVKYTIDQDSIRYTLSGAVGNADYLMLRDTFLLENNRFIGHTSEDQSYLLFFKDVTTDSISIYKQEIDNTSEGLSAIVPSDTTTQNNGWNRYGKE